MQILRVEPRPAHGCGDIGAAGGMLEFRPLAEIDGDDEDACFRQRDIVERALLAIASRPRAAMHVDDRGKRVRLAGRMIEPGLEIDSADLRVNDIFRADRLFGGFRGFHGDQQANSRERGEKGFQHDSPMNERAMLVQ